MFTSILTSKLASVALGGAIALGVVGAGSVALAQTGGSGDSPGATATATATPGNHPRLRVLAGLLNDTVAKSGLTAQTFKDGFKDGKSVNDILAANGKDAGAIQAEVLADAQARINDALTSGKITQEQANKLNEKAPAGVSKFFSTAPKHHPLRERIVKLAKAGLKTTADVLHMTPKDLVSQLRSGKSIADVAGPRTQAVTDALTAQANKAIDDALANGKITQDQAEKLKANVPARIEKFVNTVRGQHHTAP